MLFLYQIITTLLLILSPLIISFRILKKKEDKKRFKEKFCFPSKKRVGGNLVWFHGSSVGEILSIIPLIHELENYAQTGKEYTRILEQIIKQNDLDELETVTIDDFKDSKELRL